MTWQLAGAIALFLATLTFLWLRPRRWALGIVPLATAIAARWLGAIAWVDTPQQRLVIDNTTLALIGWIAIAELCRTVGLYRWLAWHLVQIARGKGLWLFGLFVLLSGVMAIACTYLGAVVLVVPVVLETSQLLQWRSPTTFAFAVSVGLLCEVASLVCPPAHLVASFITSVEQIPLWQYMLQMVPITSVTFAASAFVLWFYFRHQLTQDSDAPLGLPPKLDWQHPIAWKTWQTAPWQVMGFAWGMYLWGIGLTGEGIAALFLPLWQFLGEWGTALSALGGGFVSASLASGMTQMPGTWTALAGVRAIAPVSDVPLYATAIGCVLGAKTSPLGSLSTLLWLHWLEVGGMEVSWLQYVRLHGLLLFPILFVALWAAIAVVFAY